MKRLFCFLMCLILVAAMIPAASGETRDGGTPAVPAGFMISEYTDHSILLKWDDLYMQPMTWDDHYKIFLKNSAGGWDDVTDQCSNTSFYDHVSYPASLTEGQTYTMAVAAFEVDEDGTVRQSDYATDSFVFRTGSYKQITGFRVRLVDNVLTAAWDPYLSGIPEGLDFDCYRFGYGFKQNKVDYGGGSSNPANKTTLSPFWSNPFSELTATISVSVALVVRSGNALYCPESTRIIAELRYNGSGFSMYQNGVYVNTDGMDFDPEDEPVQIDMIDTQIEAIADQVYTGRAVQPDVKISYKGKQLVNGTDYSLAFSNNTEVGKAEVTITGHQRYRGTAYACFLIIPKAVKISSLKAGKDSLTVKWEKGKGIDGYEIEYSPNKDFTSSKTVKVTGAKKNSTVIKKLKSGRKYYVRVRSWKKVKGKKYYSAWSAAKNKKTSKK